MNPLPPEPPFNPTEATRIVRRLIRLMDDLVAATVGSDDPIVPDYVLAWQRTRPHVVRYRPYLPLADIPSPARPPVRVIRPDKPPAP